MYLKAKNATGTLDEAPKIAFLGIFGIGNIGNEATLHTTLGHLRTRIPQAVPVVVCPRPEVVESSFGITAIHWDPNVLAGRQTPSRKSHLINRIFKPFSLIRDVFYLRKKIADCAALIIPGTGVLDDYGLSSNSIPYLMMLWCLTARTTGIPVTFASIGAGPIRKFSTRRLMLLMARLATNRSYRDQSSKDFLIGIGLNASNDPVLPDLVFAYPTPSSSPRPPFSTTGGRTVGIGVMTYFGWSGNSSEGAETYRAYISRMAGFVEHILKHGFDIRFLVGKSGDEKAIADLTARLEGNYPSNRLNRGTIVTMDDLLLEIRQTDLVVAVRYHNIVASLLTCRPTLSISYADKNDVLMADAGLADYCQQIETLDVPRLIQQFDRLIAQREEVTGRLEQRVAGYRTQLDRYFDVLFSTSRSR